jgi:hypothetical protein
VVINGPTPGLCNSKVIIRSDLNNERQANPIPQKCLNNKDSLQDAHAFAAGALPARFGTAVEIGTSRFAHHSARTFGLVRNSSLSAIIILGVEKSGCEETIHLEA